jgi:hypothetical protein
MKWAAAQVHKVPKNRFQPSDSWSRGVVTKEPHPNEIA